MNPGILLIDDEQEILEVVADCLHEKEYRLFTANDGRMALEILQSEAIDLILLDLALPQESGIDLLKSYREKFPRAQVIMVTGMADEQVAKEAIRLGAADYIIKPIDLVRLEQIVDQALS